MDAFLEAHDSGLTEADKKVASGMSTLTYRTRITANHFYRSIESGAYEVANEVTILLKKVTLLFVSKRTLSSV